MAFILHAAITFDGRLTPLPAACLTPGATAFRNARRAASVCEWADAHRGPGDLHGEILAPAAAPVAAALLTGGCVDELHLVVCPLISGRRDAPTLTGPPTPEFLPAAITLKLLAMEPAGDLCFLRYRVGNSQRQLASAAAPAS